MYVKTKETGEVLILEPHGNLYLGKPQTVFEKAVQDLLDDGRKKVVVNLKHVPSIDSNGLASIIKCCYKRAKDRGALARFVIRRSSPLPLHVRTCIGLVFDVHEDEMKAVGAFMRTPRVAARAGTSSAKEYDS